MNDSFNKGFVTHDFSQDKKLSPIARLDMEAEFGIDKVCRRCHAEYKGPRISKHCPACRPLVEAERQHKANEKRKLIRRGLLKPRGYVTGDHTSCRISRGNHTGKSAGTETKTPCQVINSLLSTKLHTPPGS